MAGASGPAPDTLARWPKDGPLRPNASMDTSSAPLRRLLSQPTFRRWALANLFARLPLTMNLLVLVLVGEEVTGSVATGATLAGISTFCAGAAAQWRGRRLDRVELNLGLRQDLVASGVAVAVMATATILEAPVGVLAAIAVVQGIAFAAVLGGFRALLVHAVPPRDLAAANAMDAVFVEVAFIAGPALAGVLALLAPPSAVLALMALACGVAVVLTARLPGRPPHQGDRVAVGPAPLRTHGATPIYLLGLVLGLALGGFEAMIPARLEDMGMSAEAAGPMLALTAAGSGVAGLVAANLGDQLRRGRVVAAGLMVVFAAALVPAALAPGLALLGIALFVTGAPIAPLNALASLALQRIIAVPRQAEGFSLYPATILIGAGLGQFGTGRLLEVSSATTVLLGLAIIPAVAAVGLITAALRRRALGLPPGVGADHDPTVADPGSYATGVSTDQPSVRTA